VTVDVILLTAEIAAKSFAEGRLTEKQATRAIEKCINAASIDTGYAAKLGVPFPDTKFDDSDLDDKETK